MVKSSIIKNFEITKVPFFNYCDEEKLMGLLSFKIFKNNIDILNSIEDNYLFKIIENETIFYSTEYNSNFYKYLIISNNFDFISWIKFRNFKNYKQFCNYSCKFNNLEMLRFLRKGNDPCPWDIRCTWYAVKNNNLEMLRFLREGNDPCPWFKDCCYVAVTNNNIEILTFLREGKDKCPFGKDCILKAKETGNFKMLKFFKEGN